jgi:hypothetical protein
MTEEPITVSPREGLDNGDVHELAQDGAEVPLEVHPAHLWAFPHRDIAVPDSASGLVDGISSYGG